MDLVLKIHIWIFAQTPITQSYEFQIIMKFKFNFLI